MQGPNRKSDNPLASSKRPTLELITSLDKVLNPGTIPIGGSNANVYIKVNFNDGNLSISGVEGPLASGNCRGGCGQIDMSMDEKYISSMNFAPGWDAEKLKDLLAIWKDYHLNDMNAGSARQEAALKDCADSGYEARRKFLEERGLLFDDEHIIDEKPYEYGTSWIRRDVPQDVLRRLSQLVDSSKDPAWV